MSRQSISFTEPNDEWLKEQVDSKESTLAKVNWSMI